MVHNHWDRHVCKIQYLILMISIILLFYSFYEIKPVIVEHGDLLGLVSHLTTEYWIGFVIILLCSTFAYRDKKLGEFRALVILIIYVSFIYGLPTFVAENPKYPWSYHPPSAVKDVLQSGYIDFNNVDVKSYNSWPTLHSVSAYLIYVSKIDMFQLLNYTYIFWVLSFIFLTYSLGKKTVGTVNGAFLSTFIISSSLWTSISYYGAQSLVYILWLMFLLINLSMLLSKPLEEPLLRTKIEFMMVVNFSAIVITHMLTSILTLIPLVGSTIIYKQRYRVAIICILIFVYWYIFISTNMFQTGVKDVVRQMTQVEFTYAKTGKTNTQPSYILSMLYLAMYAVMSLVVMVLYFAKKVDPEDRKKIGQYILIMCGMSSLILINYGSEMPERLYSFNIVPVTLMVVLAFKKREKMLVILMLLFSTMYIPTSYNDDSFQIVTTSELAGNKFFAFDVYKGESLTLSYAFGFDRYYIPSNKMYGTGYHNGMYNPDNQDLEGVSYVIHSDMVERFLLYTFERDVIKLWMINSDYYSIYDNGHFNILKNF